jgi:hypothetical protein
MMLSEEDDDEPDVLRARAQTTWREIDYNAQAILGLRSASALGASNRPAHCFASDG